MADPWGHRRRTRALRDFLLARGVCRPRLSGSVHGATRRPGFLRRAYRRDGRRPGLSLSQEAAAVESGGRDGAEYRTRLCLRADWLPDERLLLRPALQPLVGNHISAHG